MAKPKKPVPKKARPKPKNWPPKKLPPKPPVDNTFQPGDYLSGSTTIGGKYNAYDTYGQGAPDFGEGAGPGTPYHVVQKTVSRPVKRPAKPRGLPSAPPIANPPRATLPARTIGAPKTDPRIEAIRRRLGWVN
jgi:hypothetical protein